MRVNKSIKNAKVKPLLLYFFMICGVGGIVALLVTGACYGILNVQDDEVSIYVSQMDGLEARDMALVPGTGGDSHTISAKGLDRLDAAILLFENQLVDQIVISGISVEVDNMTLYLLKKGIPSESILGDKKGVDTYDSVARFVEKYPKQSFYFCTQEMYKPRASYLMKQMDSKGKVICVDTMYYSNTGISGVREYFAATKAVSDICFLRGTPKTSVEDVDYVAIEDLDIPNDSEKTSENVHVHTVEVGADLPADAKVVDMNLEDDYNVDKAVEYARTYALKNNPEYPLFEYNCTNFVSQCLVAGGISMQGQEVVSDTKAYKVTKKKGAWYSLAELSQEDGRLHYSVSSSFVNTEAFIEYITADMGYPLTIYENTYDGKMKCYQELSSGDVFVLYNEEDEVAHIGLVTGIGNMNAYYCGNSNDRLEFSVFNMNDSVYPRIGIIHISGVKNR